MRVSCVTEALERRMLMAADVTRIAFDPGGTGQALAVTYDEDVTVAPGALSMFNTSLGDYLPTSAYTQQYDATTRTVTFGFAAGALPAGLYVAQVPAGAVKDAQGNAATSEASYTFVFVPDSGRLALWPGQTTVVQGLYVKPTAQLDLSSGALVIDYSTTGPLAGVSPVETVRSLLTTGYARGKWTGKGIVSSVAARAQGESVGYAEAGASGITEMEGVLLDGTAVVVRYTLAGDANLDWRVNADDLMLIDRGAAMGLTGWRNGDFNYDGVVTASDYTIVNANFGKTMLDGLGAAAGSGETSVESLEEAVVRWRGGANEHWRRGWIMRWAHFFSDRSIDGKA